MALAQTLIAVLLLSGCAKPSTETVALQSGFEAVFIQTSSFKLMSYKKSQQPKADLTIYIEGDSKPWVSDPSPRSTTVMQLATLDPSPNVVYLARPCQYSESDLKTICQSKYWSVARYSAYIVDSMNQAITQIKHSAQATKLHLIGYSGGATIAVLVAAQRDDIASLKTIAGNLDLLAMQAHHQTKPLSESLDPINVATKVKHIPQQHFIGAKDKVVPKIVAENFVRAAGLNQKLIIVLPEAGHSKGWVENWLKYVS